MPSNYPFPSVAALSLAMLCSTKTIDRLPRVVEYDPRMDRLVRIVPQTDLSLMRCPLDSTLSEGGEYL